MSVRSGGWTPRSGRRPPRAVVLGVVALVLVAGALGAAAIGGRIGDASAGAAASSVPRRGGSGVPVHGAAASAGKPALGLYFDQMTEPSKFATDADGIPTVAYDGVAQYNPTTICQQALAYYDEWYANDDGEAKRLFLKLSDWLVGNQKPDGIWEYNFAFAEQPRPWWSALAQGQAISVLARAYLATGDSRYEAAMQRSLDTFTRPQSARGVRLDDNGYAWFEEYMPPYAPHTLNGFMWALGGLREMWLAFDDARAKSLWEAGLRTLVHDLPRFDTGTWSCYCVHWPDLRGCTNASKYYQGLHVFLLRTFYRWTGEEIFRTYADRWQAEQA